MDRDILITAALPYANGEIHIGHLLEYIQADIWKRFHHSRGHQCIYLCADDTHGTPIMISSRQRGISPEELIKFTQQSHLRDFSSFYIDFDYYGSTHQASNEKLVHYFFEKMKDSGNIYQESISQCYCENDQMFLPDRFVKGFCPKCKSPEQYGDSCDQCSATYSPLDLIEPKCSLCGHPPKTKESEHLFFRLEPFKKMLKEWMPSHTNKEVSNKLMEWLNDSLRNWDISRDGPYFGFLIPGYRDKFFYVWVDAPVGYISTAMNHLRISEIEEIKNYWNEEKREIYHFIGKDITYFHTLFWPAMLQTADFKKPEQIFVHGFLTVNGEKMSKSKGTFIQAADFVSKINPETLRYYYACKLNGGVDDIDLNFQDFQNRVNSDLVGKITNLASRGAQMLQKRLDGRIGEMDTAGQLLWQKSNQQAEIIANLFEKRQFSKAMVLIRDIAEDCNKYFDDKKPWELIKENPDFTRSILTSTLNIFKTIATYLSPVLPEYTNKVIHLFKLADLNWKSIEQPLPKGLQLNPFYPLIGRIDAKSIEELIHLSKKND